MKSFFSGSAVIAATLLTSFLVLSATPSVAETPSAPPQQKKEEITQVARPENKSSSDSPETKSPGEIPGQPSSASNSAKLSSVVIEATDPAGTVANSAVSSQVPVTAPASYTATAYSLLGKTASGRRVSKGLIAADPSVLPLGTRVRLDAGAYSGEYLVADTGGAVRGKRIDIWTPSGREAMRFGRRMVKLTVLSYGPKRSALRRQRSR
jgi:3D (Asp-Asp-Asp) domain-containing protein